MQHTIQATISALPDDALLEIFKLYVDQIYREDAWHTLVHVCRKWRYVVFASPCWLHLELRCTDRRSVKKMLDVWPALPIVIDVQITKSQQSGLPNIIAALDQHDLVCGIKIRGVPNSLLESAAIKRRFSKLTHLMLRSYEENAPVIPDSSLDGSAPRLQSLEFTSIPFPALGKLLLSATDLVTFRLFDIPNSGYILPELIVTSLSALPRLQELGIGFRSPRSRADRERRHPPPLKPLVLPTLTELYFKGDSEYLEDIVGGVNAPALDRVAITFFNQLVFDAPRLRVFFSCIQLLQRPLRAYVQLAQSHIIFTLCRREGTVDHRTLEVGISSSVPEWQLSSLAQFCGTSLPPLPTLEFLVINGNLLGGELEEPTDDMESTPWLELLHSFVAVKDLYLSNHLVWHIALALLELTDESVTEVLPALRQVFVDGLGPSRPIWQVFAPFITARQLSGHPVTLRPVGISERS